MSRSHKGNIHTQKFNNVVNVNFGENDLLIDTHGIVTTAVQLGFDALEVTDTGQSHANETFQKFVHLFTTQRNHNANRHFLTQFEVGDVLFGDGGHGLLTGDGGQFGDGCFNDFLIGNCKTKALVDHDLFQDGHLHHGRIPEFLCQCRNNAFCIVLLKISGIGHYLISSPDFLDTRTNLPLAFSLRPIRVGLPDFGSTGFRLEMWMAASFFTIPP